MKLNEQESFNLAWEYIKDAISIKNQLLEGDFSYSNVKVDLEKHDKNFVKYLWGAHIKTGFSVGEIGYKDSIANFHLFINNGATFPLLFSSDLIVTVETGK